MVKNRQSSISVSVSLLKQETQPSKQNNMAIPTQEEISKQLREHFLDKRSDEEIQELTDELHKAFKDMVQSATDKDSIMAKYMPKAPHLIIHPYRTEFFMYDRERYPGDYSTLFQYSFKNYLITVAYSINQISLAYIDKNCLSFF